MGWVSASLWARQEASSRLACVPSKRVSGGELAVPRGGSCSNAIDFAGVRNGSPATSQASDLPESDTSEQPRTARRTSTRKRSGVRIPHRPPQNRRSEAQSGLPSVAPNARENAECSNACSNAIWIRGHFARMWATSQAPELRKRETGPNRYPLAAKRNGSSRLTRRIRPGDCQQGRREDVSAVGRLAARTLLTRRAIRFVR